MLGAHREKGRRVLLVVVLSEDLLGLAVYGSVEATSTPAFCGSCHEMAAVRQAWQDSEHFPRPNRAGANCRQCHLPPWASPMALLVAKARHGVTDGWRHFFPGADGDARDYFFGLKAGVLSQADDDMCLRCHAMLVAGPGTFSRWLPAIQKSLGPVMLAHSDGQGLPAVESAIPEGLAASRWVLGTSG